MSILLERLIESSQNHGTTKTPPSPAYSPLRKILVSVLAYILSFVTIVSPSVTYSITCPLFWDIQPSSQAQPLRSKIYRFPGTTVPIQVTIILYVPITGFNPMCRGMKPVFTVSNLPSPRLRSLLSFLYFKIYLRWGTRCSSCMIRHVITSHCNRMWVRLSPQSLKPKRR